MNRKPREYTCGLTPEHSMQLKPDRYPMKRGKTKRWPLSRPRLFP